MSSNGTHPYPTTEAPKSAALLQEPKKFNNVTIVKTGASIQVLSPYTH
jgi:hypothetical protein